MSETSALLEHETTTLLADRWVVLLWDDPVNVMEYVTHALRKVLFIDQATASQLMMKAHTDGKVAVFSGERGQAEECCLRLHAWSLQATLVKDGGGQDG